ncbi:GLE1-like protein-domain-containing protein [Ephemerocybe angulata]|uniref:mRNA export factor GLE1 n=1 Tax=Ephemerocybe angulata TaxID=980116 RepID=A0A8H6I803_9AGAR|nr:GLE1-like protein-domain-containing protein [Tulosesus angulatus]
MRFGLPRSPTTSRARGYRRGASTFGLHSDSDDDDYDFNAYDSDSSSSSSSSQSSRTSSDKPPPDGRVRSPEETREKEETIATIRLWTRHRDPYEEWEKKTRLDAFKTARKELSTTQSSLHASQSRLSTAQDETLSSTHAKEMSEIESQLSRFRLAQEKEEAALRQKWKEREAKLWERIEGVIRIEEDKVRAKLEAERQKREKEEAAKKEEEMRRQLLEQKRRKEEEAKQKAEEERKREEEEKREKERVALEEERVRKEKEAGDREAREKLGYTTASEDWAQARESLLALKDNVMSVVKANKELKAEYNAVRRTITPKLGQITPDAASIQTISTQLLAIMKPATPHRPAIYAALCNFLAKRILLQAETEVTAEKRSAGPLAKVTFNLLTSLDIFPEVLWAKLVQRVGGWPVPAIVPEVDVDKRAWGSGAKRPGRGGENERWRVMGYRESGNGGGGLEAAAEYATRVAGVVRVYWEVVKVQLGVPERAPSGGPFAVTRFWIWFARILDSKALLTTAVGAELIYTGLEVLGAEAADIWGVQWIKLLKLIHEGTTTGMFGEKGTLIGGDSPEGKAAKARVQMEVERIVSGERKQ